MLAVDLSLCVGRCDREALAAMGKLGLRRHFGAFAAAGGLSPSILTCAHHNPRTGASHQPTNGLAARHVKQLQLASFGVNL